MDIRALGDLLVDAGCVPRTIIDGVLARSPFSGEERVRAELTALTAEHEAALCEAIAEKLQAPVLVLSSSTLDLVALRMVPAAFVREHRVLPVLADGATLTVAATRAELPGLIEHLEAATAHRVIVVAAIEPLLVAAIDAAFVALSAGALALPGVRSPSAAPSLHLARAPIRLKMPRADSVARALGAVLDEALGRGRTVPTQLNPPSSSSSSSPSSHASPASPASQLGALRLKQVAVSRPSPSGPGPTTTTQPNSPSPAEGVDAVRVQPLCMVVEDDDGIRGLIARVLRHDGCEVDEAADGRVAAQALRRRRPDLIVLDAMLPHVHGFELCAAIKRSPSWCSVPVIMISAVFKGLESARDIQEVHGADAFLEKPFEITRLRHVAADLLKRPRPSSTVTRDQLAQGERSRLLLDHHLARGEVDDARRVIAEWLSADPFCPRAWLEHGNFAVQAGDEVAALRAFELASTYDGTLFVAHASLAMMYERLGFARRARVTWEKAAATAPEPSIAARIRHQLG